MSDQTTFAQPAQTSLSGILPSYAFQEYADDQNIQAFFAAFNAIAQQYQDWFNQINLPIYTGSPIVGPLLDWVAQGIYGLSRPAFPYGVVSTIGPLNTWGMNTYILNSFTVSGAINEFVTSDDVFKRIITWYFFKGDGQYFNIIWLKRRIMRFLLGTAGTDPPIIDIYPIGVSFPGANNVTITITLTNASQITLPVAQLFHAGVQSGALPLPFQWSWTVVLVNDLATTYLTNVAGVLNVSGSAVPSWPTSSSGLPDGAVWSNSGVVTIVSGITPNPYASALFFGVETASSLLFTGGGDLPTSNPGVGSLQIWNNSGVANVA